MPTVLILRFHVCGGKADDDNLFRNPIRQPFARRTFVIENLHYKNSWNLLGLKNIRNPGIYVILVFFLWNQNCSVGQIVYICTVKVILSEIDGPVSSGINESKEMLAFRGCWYRQNCQFFPFGGFFFVKNNLLKRN